MIVPDIFQKIHDMPPVDTTFVAGRWHHDRVTLKGYSVEARVFLKCLITPRNNNTRFLVIGRARSGTTLLTHLLNSHSQIHCDDEVLQKRVLNPAGHFKRLAQKSSAPIYGAKFLSYQMVQTYRMKRPDIFLKRLADSGVILIHLERDTFFQTLSLIVAQSRQAYHSDQGATPIKKRLRVDPDNFVARIAWSEALLAYERAAFRDIDHIHISYDRQMSEPEMQSHIVAMLSARLGAGQEKLETPLKKILPTDPYSILENYTEVRAKLVEQGYEYVLPNIKGQL